MHFMVLVIGNDYEKILRPYSMEDEHGKVREQWKYDWYKKGGRWTGFLSGYDPSKDSQNLNEKGQVKWPTQWNEHKGDQTTVQDFLQMAEKDKKLLPSFCAFVDQKGWTDYQTWDIEKKDFIDNKHFVEQLQQVLVQSDPQTLVTIVDCHS